MASTIYLHWTATHDRWIRPGHYHSIVTGDGQVHRLHAYDVDLPAHTWRRNTNSVALAVACMGGIPDPWMQSPSAVQLTSLCQEAASLARHWGWGADEITLERVMTHAEAAANRDGRMLHDNYGPVIWGGSGERWDLLQLHRDGAMDGGERLRDQIREQLTTLPGREPSDRLQFRGVTEIEVRGKPFKVQLDHQGRSWAPTTDLLDRYQIPFRWDEASKRIVVQTVDVVPTFREDAVQRSLGWPIYELSIQSGAAPVVLVGILRSEMGKTKAWCRVLEFAEEFGISVRFDPFGLGERRGG
jgi:hypothetical protein